MDLPPSVASVLTLPSIAQSHELTTLVSHLPASLVASITTSPSVTLFAPINQAFIDALASGHITNSTTPSTYLGLFENHIINGTIVHTGSPQKNYTSAGGQQITVGTGGLLDGSGSVVYYRGEQVANIVFGDIITQNGQWHFLFTPDGSKIYLCLSWFIGVLHLIDAVLPNSSLNPTAANSAYSVAKATASASPLRRRTASRFFGARQS